MSNNRERKSSLVLDDKAKHAKTYYTETINKLNKYYQLVKKQIIRYQALSTGLFPTDPTDLDCKTTHVRDNIYCAVAIWALSQAYKRIDDDQGRIKELSLTAVKTMRGILECWMGQSEKVEKFKATQSPKNALHVIFDIDTLQPATADGEHGHLQLDCIGLYLIFLVQMIHSGCQIIWTTDEVNFIQNLVFYVERAYRTPDFGVWERGSKYNNGSTELHASSIGMAKAALETINGMNMFGNQGASWSVIFIDIDAHYRNRIIFDTLLPRESTLENTDAALIGTVSWPAFAIHEGSLVQRTMDKALRKLKGKYGLKRFLRDGYGTSIEDKSRKFYKTSEIKLFDGIECEWPMFYCYLAIDSMYKGDHVNASKYMEKLSPLLIDGVYGPVIPKYYYVPKDKIEAEKEMAGSQVRLSSYQPIVSQKNEFRREDIFFIGQSVYIIAQLLVEGLINLSELDPIKRHLPAAERPRTNMRYSAFQSSPTDLVIQVSLISESVRLQQMLATYGIQTQTPHQIEPIQIFPPSELARLYEHLGENKKLGLSGRPPRPFGGLSTSKIYRACGSTFICYPLLFAVSDFYLSQDMEFVLDDVKTHLAFLGKCWKLAGRPTFCAILRERNLSGHSAHFIFDLLAQFKQGNCDGTKIRLGRLQEFISSSCIEHLDFLDSDFIDSFNPFVEKDLAMQFQSFTDIPKLLKNETPESWICDEIFGTMNVGDLIHGINEPENIFRQCQMLRELSRRKGLHFVLKDSSIEDLLEKNILQAASTQLWSAVRYCSSVLNKMVDSLAPSITAILVRGKQLTLGVIGQTEHVIDKPLTPMEIKELLYTKIYPFDVVQAVLQQELIIDIGMFITNTPELFDGIMRIRIGWLLEAMKLELGLMTEGGPAHLAALSPSSIKKLLQRVLRRVSNDSFNYPADRSIMKSRQLDGCLNRVPMDFYDRIWHILERTPPGFKLAGYILPQQPTLSDMTQYELNFSLLIEQMLCKIADPAYRQIIVEIFVIIDSILARNPEMTVNKAIDIDQILMESIQYFLKDIDSESTDVSLFFNTAPNKTRGTTVYIIRTVINSLLDGDISAFSESNCCIM